MLLFMDGQAHYDTTRIGLKYSSVSSVGCTWAVTSEGRFGNCLRRTSTSNVGQSGYLSVAPLTTRLGTWTPTTGGVCGFAVKVDALSAISDTPESHHSMHDFFVVVEGSYWHVKVRLNQDGTFTLVRAQGGITELVLAQSVEGLTSGAWAFVEFRWVIDAAAGSFAIRVNGLTVLSYTGGTIEINPSPSTLGVWNAVRLLTVPSATPAPFLTLRMCDLYLADLATADADDVSDYLGDGIIETILPNGAGASTGWTPNTGANWEATNDSPAPDDDATYVAATPVGTTDTYHFEDLPPGTIVKGVHVCILARKETEGSAAVAPIVHQGGVDYVGPTQGVANVVYDHYITQAYDLNPATSAKFTSAEVNAGQFGVRKMA